MGIIFDHGIEDHQHRSHAGGDHHFEWFSLGFEAFGELPDRWIVASCGQRGHIENASDGSDGCPAAPNGSFATEASAVVVERSQADQCGDFPTVEHSQFGKLG